MEEMLGKVSATGVVVCSPKCADDLTAKGVREECVKLLCTCEDQSACADKVADACFEICSTLCPTHGA